MSCGRFDRLLALDSGGDLAPRDADALAAHLAGCDSCRRAAEEFAGARTLLLDAFEPPEFEAAFYESVRRGVMRELDAAPPPTGLGVFFRRLFSAPVYAAALAVVVLFAALALVLRTRDAGEAGGQTQEVVVRDDGQQTPPPAAPTPDAQAPNAVTPPPPPASQTHERAQAERTVRKNVQAAGFRHRRGPVEEIRNQVAPVMPQDPAPAVETAGLGATEERRMLRIELQTSDPNVRIIWLTPEKSDRR